MAEPITPRFYADEVVLERVWIQYSPVWDGAAWVITPADVVISCIGNLSEDGVWAARSDIEMVATDLPPAGQNALNELYQYIEQQMALQYA